MILNKSLKFRQDCPILITYCIVSALAPPYSDNISFQNEVLDTIELPQERQTPRKLIQLEKKVEPLRPVKKPSFHVPYLKKEKFAKKPEKFKRIVVSFQFQYLIKLFFF